MTFLGLLVKCVLYRKYNQQNIVMYFFTSPKTWITDVKKKQIRQMTFIIFHLEGYVPIVFI